MSHQKNKPEPPKVPAPIHQQKLPPKIENMEVHHHGHVHEKKKWKEYLFQFFMLFLAVFCGFLAEYRLEQTIERHREDEYATSMINDLKMDTAHIGQLTAAYTMNIGMQDSILRFFDRIRGGFNVQLERQSRSIRGFPDFIYTDGTIQQLRNSGGFRLMRNRPVVDSILAYDADVKKLLINERVLGEELMQLVDMEKEIYDYQKIDAALLTGMTPQEMEAQKLDVLTTTDPAKLASFYSQIRYYKTMCSVVHGQFLRLKDRATRLLEFIQQEYD